MILLGGRRLATSGPEVGGACELSEESAGQRSDRTRKGQGTMLPVRIVSGSRSYIFGNRIGRLVACQKHLVKSAS
jgi:hypothetical protein